MGLTLQFLKVEEIDPLAYKVLVKEHMIVVMVEKHCFFVFNYQSGQDSVLYVKNEDYANCNTGSPYAKFYDGHTVIKLNQSGPHFFISGNKDNCLKNEKVTVIVLADRNNHNSSNTNQRSNASPPSPQSYAPSPTPYKQEGQSPPPSGIVESNPSPAPVYEPPPPNAAASIFFNYAASIGTFMASLLLLSF
ncbi:hypothetical protein TanjilG_11660 [Lupinus angustifolius]|uniref:Phytocyanin domain-containing protein n=1 Tax=Lupinus angustifolius TaxID=3871 RepID=A0A1J7HW21_LUPAN|nr:hypothetical protein TanjilG_11658 [Lupinus angustifolius]OIW05973.1 hypothetical protein TanjilG_11660 [Lupinus angustifolius]